MEHFERIDKTPRREYEEKHAEGEGLDPGDDTVIRLERLLHIKRGSNPEEDAAIVQKFGQRIPVDVVKVIEFGYNIKYLTKDIAEVVASGYGYIPLEETKQRCITQGESPFHPGVTYLAIKHDVPQPYVWATYYYRSLKNIRDVLQREDILVMSPEQALRHFTFEQGTIDDKI